MSRHLTEFHETTVVHENGPAVQILSFCVPSVADDDVDPVDDLSFELPKAQEIGWTRMDRRRIYWHWRFLDEAMAIDGPIHLEPFSPGDVSKLSLFMDEFLGIGSGFLPADDARHALRTYLMGSAIIPIKQSTQEGHSLTEIVSNAGGGLLATAFAPAPVMAAVTTNMVMVMRVADGPGKSIGRLYQERVDEWCRIPPPAEAGVTQQAEIVQGPRMLVRANRVGSAATIAAERNARTYETNSPITTSENHFRKKDKRSNKKEKRSLKNEKATGKKKKKDKKRKH